ncbi:hypothetical protein HOLDEFILI_02695 [Holdemania filiformis DSM 12042]|uniref:Uncharacterized protein n=1 Tax=Holdemania filiformis DSM 12042 TaxID=545696 RepID=B9YA38_9FIRM|nr:hypothetical protein HOLDEFILI_02695 [Holdemania filiformis DSM 12042]
MIACHRTSFKASSFGINKGNPVLISAFDPAVRGLFFVEHQVRRPVVSSWQ